MLEDYYLDELLLVLDAYAEMQQPKEEPVREYYADEFED